VAEMTDAGAGRPTGPRLPSLRMVVLAATGQDLRRCSHCSFCSDALKETAGLDLGLEMVLQLAVINDEEVLTSRTLWSDRALDAARHACTSGLDIGAVLLALRDEARQRGLTEEVK